MDSKIRQDIKINLKNSLRHYVTKFSCKNTQPLDLLIPKERKIRSVVGGLETSMGTTVWEPVAKTLAEFNGFEVVKEKILIPQPFPSDLAGALSTLISLRENSSTWISVKACVEKLIDISKKVDRSSMVFVKPPAGTGVDIRLRKNGKEYAYDIKTVQPNVGSIKSFNKQILEWYAYSICRDPNIEIECRIAYPYNPHSDYFWSHTPHKGGILEPSVDAVVENEFWDFISGQQDTYQEITQMFIELNNEGFGKELSDIIESLRPQK